MYFNLSPKSSTDTFSNLGLIHPLMIGNEFATPPIQLSEESQSDYEIICKYALKQKWTQWIDFKSYLKENTNTVVITDTRQIIRFASAGFERMTGYSTDFARGKSPKILQGKDTEPEVRANIREAIQKRQMIDAVLTNYRKNGEPYLCKVTIYPMFNKTEKLVNFLALESEVSE
ncbi:PAS domain S-box-containing protein [Arcicella aurantiaca]|uniref:PAS domain S-box-containing protein n=1 Tax=Arcicella aurantiaca TaxID=591202 RepID=A0A316DH01_9BACT|nr:PAS domain-containing protein [Arcicella aurantiaca]PWK17461.1 PAS domain S-box-containing protein [Arcicella aurantiaca]